MQQLIQDPATLLIAIGALITALVGLRQQYTQRADIQSQVRMRLWSDVQEELTRRDNRIDKLEAQLDAYRRYTTYLHDLLTDAGIDSMSFNEWWAKDQTIEDDVPGRWWDR